MVLGYSVRLYLAYLPTEWQPPKVTGKPSLGKMLHAEAGSEERKRLRDALLAYCKQDTLAMVRMLEVLQAA